MCFVGGGEYNYNRTDRIALLSTTKPDPVVALLSVNDDGSSQASLTTAVTTWTANVRQAAGPNAWIVVIGETGKQTLETESPNEGCVRLATAAINDPKLVFIPATGDPTAHG